MHTERKYEAPSWAIIRILNIPDDLTDEEKQKLEQKKNELIELIGEERANSQTARASTPNE